MPLEELAKVWGINLALMQRMVRAGCPTVDGAVSNADLVRWLIEHYLAALSEYSVESLPKDGYYCELSRYWVLRPVTEWELHDAEGWLAVGGPGVDGIAWAVKKNETGLFAFYPIEREFVYVAKDGPALVSNWNSGTIAV